MEYLDIVDEHGTPTGETVERNVAHSEGIRHRTSHVWLLRKRDDEIQILLQKRSTGKDSYPGFYDISSAGHIPAGGDFIPSALRELREELGYIADADDLILCGIRRFFHHEVFHGKPFLDHQVSRVFALWTDVEASAFTLQASEVEAVQWMDFNACKTAVHEQTIPTCICPDELDMVEAAVLKRR